MAVDWTHQSWSPFQGDSELKLNRIRYGFAHGGTSEPGESVVVCQTTADCVEIHCHGGRMAAEQIIQHLVSLGAVQRTPRERLLETLSDEFAREATEDLLSATTFKTTSILLDQLRGALSSEFEQVEALTATGDFESARIRLKILSNRISAGRHLISPWKVVLAGPPNAGKSSLLNRLLGYTRAIVHEQAGTTRDSLSETSSIDGWPMEIVDGAGIRPVDEASDSIESAGILRSLQRIQGADCTLLLVDSLFGWTEVHQQILSSSNGKLILIWTKSDLATGSKPLIPTPVADAFDAIVSTSCVTGDGVQSLLDAIVQVLIPENLLPGDAVPFRPRHEEWISRQREQIERLTET